MKIKKVVFKIIAMIIAIIGTVGYHSEASSLVIDSGYILYLTQGESTWYCDMVNLRCDNAGTLPCTAHIFIGSFYAPNVHLWKIGCVTAQYKIGFEPIPTVALPEGSFVFEP